MGLLNTNRCRGATAIVFVLIAAVLIVPTGLFAADAAAPAGGQAAFDFPKIFLFIAILLMLAKVSSLIERLGQPAVLGELIMGVALGSLYLLGIDFFENIKSNEIIHFLAELGVVILLFQIGIESSVRSMMKVGVNSFLVACVGVILPLVAVTYFVGPWLVPGLHSSAYLFLGATLTATSVGITARVLKDIGRADSSEARIIIGAAVIDDVLGLIVLAVVAAIVKTGSISASDLTIILVKATLFLGGGVLLGAWIAPRLSRLLSTVHTGVGMKFALVISFGLVFSYIAHLMGLAPIVGAFTAGLILTPVQFKNFSDPPFIEDLRGIVREEHPGGTLARKIETVIETHSHRHITDFTEHLGHFLVPIFFILTGMQVKIAAMADAKIILMAAGLFVAAVVTKILAGVVAGKGMNKLAVGIGMIPRGEVGLIFASMGKGLGVMDDAVFSAMVVVVMLTTLITPPMLAAALRRN